MLKYYENNDSIIDFRLFDNESKHVCAKVFMSEYWLKLVHCFSAFLLHVGVGVVLFAWTPQKEDIYVFFICVVLLVIGYSVYSSVLSCK